MKKALLFLTVSFVLTLSLPLDRSGLAYYWPPDHVPPGPPPNYNQVDTTYFKGVPTLPLPPPEDSGGLYVYYDQGEWCIANHIYSPGNSFEQFHCCVLAVMGQPPTLGVNVFIEEFELWVDTTQGRCLYQNDRWGWIPWGDSLYEIWWDVATREWKQGAGDPNDFMCFKIAGCAVDFNFWSSGHGAAFGPDQIYLGENKILLSSVPGFTDTYPGINDPYQSQAGTDPANDPNITIFTFKSDTLRSYNKNGLIDSTDSYNCQLALQYGERYAGTFAYEGNGVQFSTSSLCVPNQDPDISISPDTSVFVCVGDSVCIWIFASDPDAEDTITVEKIYGAGTYTPITDLTPISDTFCFYPDTGGIYAFIFKVTDMHGATGYDTTHVTVDLNQPPQITCPTDDSVHAGDTFISTDFVPTDPDGDSALVTFLDISPSATNNPTIVDNHVEWVTTSDDGGDYVIRLVATDPCGAEDTCEFNVCSQNFIISTDPDTQYVTCGDSVGYLVKLTSLCGFDESCTLLVSGLPDPPDSGIFDQTTLIPTDSTTLNVYTTTDTDTGWHSLTITAQSSSVKLNSLQHSIQVVLYVTETTDVGDWADNPNSPKSFALLQNQPNPFNPETRISYYLPKTCEVRLIIYNILGQNVRTLFDGHQDTGMHTLLWDGRDKNGVELSSGIYFYRLQADDFCQTKKMALLR
jgi:hypothetical protein